NLPDSVYLPRKRRTQHKSPPPPRPFSVYPCPFPGQGRSDPFNQALHVRLMKQSAVPPGGKMNIHPSLRAPIPSRCLILQNLLAPFFRSDEHETCRKRFRRIVLQRDKRRSRLHRFRHRTICHPERESSCPPPDQPYLRFDELASKSTKVVEATLN